MYLKLLATETHLKSSEEEREDLKDVLIKFWLQTVNGDFDAEYPERLKASEMLAKYILASGRATVPKGQIGRPSTSELLKLAQMYEQEDGTSGESSREEI